MVNLKEQIPDIYSYLPIGGYSIQIGPKKPVGRIPVDQTIEDTVNKDTQIVGGTKWFNLTAGTVRRY